ncbi:hypothetical protein GW17_00024387 [Ensete ventricosum]|nr:hypothetical protein GW17_00024387 [Ensete ventricosum]
MKNSNHAFANPVTIAYAASLLWSLLVHPLLGCDYRLCMTMTACAWLSAHGYRWMWLLPAYGRLLDVAIVYATVACLWPLACGCYLGDQPSARPRPSLAWPSQLSSVVAMRTHCSLQLLSQADPHVIHRKVALIAFGEQQASDKTK